MAQLVKMGNNILQSNNNILAYGTAKALTLQSSLGFGHRSTGYSGEFKPIISYVDSVIFFPVDGSHTIEVRDLIDPTILLNTIPRASIQNPNFGGGVSLALDEVGKNLYIVSVSSTFIVKVNYANIRGSMTISSSKWTIPFSYPAGAGLDVVNGHIFMINQTLSGTVYKYTTSGALVNSTPLGTGVQGFGLALDGDRIIVSTSSSTIVTLDKNLNIISTYSGSSGQRGVTLIPTMGVVLVAGSGKFYNYGSLLFKQNSPSTAPALVDLVNSRILFFNQYSTDVYSF